MSTQQAVADHHDEAIVKTARPSTTKPKLLAFHYRVIYALGGAALFIAFFLPWIRLGDLAQISGLELMISNNVLFQKAITRTHRMLVGLIPLLGVLMATSASRGWRITPAIALGTCLYTVGYGISALIAAFFSATSMGLWVVAIASLACLGTALLAVTKASR